MRGEIKKFNKWLDSKGTVRNGIETPSAHLDSGKTRQSEALY
jgi:hypothetical protein